MQASVVVRVRDEAGALECLLPILERQTLPHEVIVVDNESSDGSRDVAARHGARVLPITEADFSFGGALNIGAAVAEAPVVVSLSAHAYPRDDTWLVRVVTWFDDPAVVCAYGDEHDWDGRPLAGPVRQDAEHLRAHPEWGYSNGAGAFRAALWRERRFREDMPATEDREWALWALEKTGGVCVIDPLIAVDHDHTRDSLRATFRRARREARGFGMFLDLPPYRPADAAREWWTGRGWHRSRTRARLDPRRMARLAGKWAGRRAR